jgi:hypothetical protein
MTKGDPMNTPWRMIGYCGAMVVLLGIGRAWGQAHAAPAPPVVEMVIPEAVDKNTHVECESFSINARTGEAQTAGNVRIAMPNGVRLRIHGARVILRQAGTDRARHLLISVPDPTAKL